MKSAAKKKTWATLNITKKKFEDKELPHESFLTTIHKTETRNAFANRMLADIKLRKTQLSRIILAGGFLGALLGKFASRIKKVGVPLAKSISAPLASMTSISAIDSAIQRKMRGEGVDEGTDYIIKVMASLENSEVLIDGINEAVKQEIKKQENWFLDMLGNMLTGKGVMRAGNEYNMGNSF